MSTWRKEVENVLGKPNVDLLNTEVREGKINKRQLKIIAEQMHGNVHGVFQNNKKDTELKYLFPDMLDSWYQAQLHKAGFDGISRLKEILALKNLELDHLVEKIKHHTEKLTIGLPGQHPEIPRNLLRKPNITGQPAVVSNQSSYPVCGSHAVAKAVVQILDGYGYDCDQKKIIGTLVGCDQEARNPDYFNGKKIKVNVTQRGDGREGEIELEVKVQTQGSLVGNDMEFNLDPWVPLPEDMKMVLRWDIGMTLSDRGIYGLHAIFAKKYNKDNCTFSCINSWGSFLEEPTISRSRIYAVDYITIIQI